MSKAERGRAPGAAGATAKPRSGPHTVRVIGGQWRRTILPVLDVEGLRPTPDRVRETLFNWISHFGELEGADVLDLFAGTGALGIESASRGAASVVLVDGNPKVARSLTQTIERLHAHTMRVEQRDAMAYLREHNTPSFDLVFLDPPFHGDWLERVLAPVAALLRPSGMVYVETERALDESAIAAIGLTLLRADKAGQVVYHLLRRNIDAAGSAPDNEEEKPC